MIWTKHISSDHPLKKISTTKKPKSWWWGQRVRIKSQAATTTFESYTASCKSSPNFSLHLNNSVHVSAEVLFVTTLLSSHQAKSQLCRRGWGVPEPIQALSSLRFVFFFGKQHPDPPLVQSGLLRMWSSHFEEPTDRWIQLDAWLGAAAPDHWLVQSPHSSPNISKGWAEMEQMSLSEYGRYHTSLGECGRCQKAQLRGCH